MSKWDSILDDLTLLEMRLEEELRCYREDLKSESDINKKNTINDNIDEVWNELSDVRHEIKKTIIKKIENPNPTDDETI